MKIKMFIFRRGGTMSQPLSAGIGGRGRRRVVLMQSRGTPAVFSFYDAVVSEIN